MAAWTKCPEVISCVVRAGLALVTPPLSSSLEALAGQSCKRNRCSFHVSKRGVATPERRLCRARPAVT
jgi:hypothetical protein